MAAEPGGECDRGVECLQRMAGSCFVFQLLLLQHMQMATWKKGVVFSIIMKSFEPVDKSPGPQE